MSTREARLADEHRQRELGNAMAYSKFTLGTKVRVGEDSLVWEVCEVMLVLVFASSYRFRYRMRRMLPWKEYSFLEAPEINLTRAEELDASLDDKNKSSA